MRVEPEKPQDAQIVLANAVLGLVDKAQVAGAQVGNPTQRINDGPIRPGIKRIHGEITPMRVLFGGFGKGNHGTAPVGFHILSKRGDLEGFMVHHNRHRAMVIAGRHRFEPGQAGHFDHLVRGRIGRNVDIRDRHVQQRIAHAAADEQRLEASVGQHRADRLRGRAGQPVIGDAGHPCTRSASARSMRAVAPQM